MHVVHSVGFAMGVGFGGFYLISMHSLGNAKHFEEGMWGVLVYLYIGNTKMLSVTRFKI